MNKIAVAGVSRGPEPAVGNAVYNKMKKAGYNVFAVNPNAVEVEGDKCYPNIKSIPSGVDAVFVATKPGDSLSVARDCKETGVKLLWLHSSFGQGSASDDTVKYCYENGISVIPSACPMMYIQPVDFGHKCIKGVLKLTGKVPFGM